MPCGRHPLKMVRLPISPLPRDERKINNKGKNAGALGHGPGQRYPRRGYESRGGGEQDAVHRENCTEVLVNGLREGHISVFRIGWGGMVSANQTKRAEIPFQQATHPLGNEKLSDNLLPSQPGTKVRTYYGTQTEKPANTARTPSPFSP